MDFKQVINDSRQYLKYACNTILETKDMSWETKYHTVFKVEFHEMVQEVLGKIPDYYDPDSSYEDDVRAYLNAILSELEEK